MLETAKLLIEETEGIVNDCLKTAFQADGLDFIADCPPELLSVIQRYCTLMKISKRYVLEQAELMETMNNRIKELLEQAEKLEAIDRKIDRTMTKIDRLSETK